MRLRPIQIAITAILSATVARAEDLAYVSDEELVAEIADRDNDIQRTTERIATLSLEELELAIAIDDARTQLREIDRRLAGRVGLLYRLSHSGAAIRFLVAASSATEFLKRLRTLRHIVLDGLTDRRQAGLRVAETTERLVAVREDQLRAKGMLEQLGIARDQLRAALRRRSIKP